MATYPETQGAPIELPESIYNAFKDEGYDPLTVIMFDESGEATTFVRSGVSVEGPTQFTASDLELPHLTVQDIKLKSSSKRCCKVFCSKYGCFKHCWDC